MKIKSGFGVGVSIETGEITDASVTAVKLATDAVETAKIKDANVTAVKLATDAVETAKIKDANVTIAKLPQTNRAALLYVRANAGNTELEYGSPQVTADTNLTIKGVTFTLEQWLETL